MAHHRRYPRIVTPPPRVWTWDEHWNDDGAFAHDDDDYERDECDRCGGDGHIEYLEAGPDVWVEDCPAEENHLVTCPDCGGTGTFRR